MRKYKKILPTLCFILLFPSIVRSEVQVSGMLDMVVRDINQSDITNETFRGFSNFNTIRSRIFVDASINDKTTAFVQILMDGYAFQLYGAYVRFERLWGPYLNIQAGLIPSPVGSFATRSYSNVNPLIGTPLTYNFHSSFIPMRSDPVGTIDDLVDRKTSRSNFGLPIIYDACWNSGAEFYGAIGRFNYSLGLLAGSSSKPLQQQSKNVPQVTTRLSYSFDPGMVLGGSVFYGPYLVENMLTDSLPPGSSINDYINSGVAVDLLFARGLVEIYSEIFWNKWEYPAIEDLTVVSGYAEVKYKFYPSWYVAGRFGWFQPGEVTVNGSDEPWDVEVKRYEFGLGHWFSRSVLAKLVTQINRFGEFAEMDSEHVAMQLSINLR